MPSVDLGAALRVGSGRPGANLCLGDPDGHAPAASFPGGPFLIVNKRLAPAIASRRHFFWGRGRIPPATPSLRCFAICDRKHVRRALLLLTQADRPPSPRAHSTRSGICALAPAQAPAPVLILPTRTLASARPSGTRARAPAPARPPCPHHPCALHGCYASSSSEPSS